MDIKSYAKINVSLRVLGKKEDGYHNLEMVNLPIDLHDVISVDKLGGGDTYIICDDLRLMGLKTNLCQKAVEAMRNHFHFKENFMIHIHKEIPFAAGLGGGSSNAACVMMAINSLLKLKATNEELAEIGRPLGADIPFFFYLKPAKVTGIGEIIEPIKCLHPYYCLLVKPEKGLATKDVFAACDSFEPKRIDTDGVVKALANGNDELLAKSIGNDLMAAAVKLLPEVGEVYSSLMDDGFHICQMSGSGSTVYALSTNLKKCKEAEKKYSKLGYITILTKTLL